MKTNEAQRLVALLGDQGFSEYLTDLFGKMSGNFDETVKHMSVHAMAVEKMQASGLTPTFQLLQNAPTQQDMATNTQVQYPIAPPPVQLPPTPAPVYRTSFVQQAPQVLSQNQSVAQAQPSKPVQQNQTPVQNSQYRLSVPPPQSPLATPIPQVPNQQVIQAQQVDRPPTNTPNYVNAFQPGVYLTAGIGGYPGHQGEDYAYDPASLERSVTNPIGGIPFGGYQTGGFGNYQGIIGANPQEAAQMSPQERQAILDEINSKMPTASGLTDMNIRGKNVAILGHLANSTANQPNYMATGSAKLQMGNTGNSSGLHTHVEMMGPDGNLQSYTELLKKYGGKQAPAKSGPTGGGVNPQLAGLVSQSANAFKSIVRPIQSVGTAPKQTVTPPVPMPVPTPAQPRVSNVVSAPRSSSVYYAPQSSPSSTTYSNTSTSRPNQSPVTYTAPRPAPVPTPTPAPSYNSYQSKPATNYSTPMSTYKAPVSSQQPMMSTYKAPMSYARPAPQQSFFTSALKTITNLFK